MKKRKFKIRHLLLMALFCYIISNLAGRQIAISKMHGREAQIRQEMQEALDEQERLKREIELLHTDEYMEALARDELGLAKPDEIIYKYIKDEDD